LPVSQSGQLEVVCPKCKQAFTAEVWPLVDLWERPDLAQRLQQGLLHIATCTHCEARVNVDTPLLIYRRYKEPSVIFSMPPKTAKKDALKYGASLLAQLRDALADDWRDEWLQQQHETIDRVEARVQLNLDLVLLARQMLMNEEAERDLDAGQAPPVLQALWRFLSAEGWDDTRRVIDENPILLSNETLGFLDELVRASYLQRDDDLASLFSQHLVILSRCIEVGVEAAISEAAASPADGCD